MFNFRCIQKLLQYLKFFFFLLIENTFCIFSRPKKSFAGEIVLITGSANGIGRQVALKLAPLGVNLVLWDIDDEGNKETSRLAQQNGASRVFVYHCDCSSREDVYEQADKVRREVGDVTILINNVGAATAKKFCELTDEDFEKTFRINFFSQVWTLKAFLPAMVACNRGHLVSTASGAGLQGLYRLSGCVVPFTASELLKNSKLLLTPVFGVSLLAKLDFIVSNNYFHTHLKKFEEMTYYSASKSAIIGMMEAINSELYHGGKHGIKTTIICPYFISTRLSRGFKSAKPCLFPIYDPEYAASRIVDAIKKEKFYLIMPPAVHLLVLKVKAVLFLESYVKFPESMEEAFGRKKKE